MDTADGSPIRNQQLSYLDMFGYSRRGSETRPSVYSSVTLPVNPTPSTSNDSGAGYHNGTLQYICICVYIGGHMGHGPSSSYHDV